MRRPARFLSRDKKSATRTGAGAKKKKRSVERREIEFVYSKVPKGDKASAFSRLGERPGFPETPFPLSNHSCRCSWEKRRCFHQERNFNPELMKESRKSRGIRASLFL